MKNMQLGKYWLKGYLGILAIVVATSANAIPINGSISFEGSYYITNSALTIDEARVRTGTQSGVYASGLDGKDAFFATFDYLADTTLTPLWSITVGSVTYNFDATSINNNGGTPGDSLNPLHLFGTGVAYISGYTPTSGYWDISILPPGQDTKFSFVSSSTAVPDGGATVLLLGGALSVLGLLSRKFA